MSLKELTKEKHIEAENTLFMKTVFKKAMPKSIWVDYTYNKFLIYSAIELKSRAEGILDDLPNIDRSYKLYQDYKNMREQHVEFRKESMEYYHYILDLPVGKVLAHLYTWHMGDLYGGQMIKKIMPNFSHTNLDFENPELLKVTIRNKLDDSLADEANEAFARAIRLMRSYDDQLDI